MFDKILIANRGEIACRIMRTCKRLGIKTVAVYSEADADALHVRIADEAILIGPASASQSYLSIPAIIEACGQTGADAIHPGYGFLSENAAFVEAVEAAGIVFIGPPAEAVRLMGDKLTSKRIATEAGVNTVPGSPGPVNETDEAVRIAREIGYPVMLKASAGGGGKGMRLAQNESELIDGLTRTRSEAKAAFSDDRVFLEKFITTPRHIEIQVLADCHGKTIHLGERECSIQRRHQKVIEEAPSPFLDVATRDAMGAQAVALAKRVGYASAGTVEFIVDADRNFYFLEMNTRLQVEHPVTELVTGIDLVEQMIAIAADQPLSLSQEDVKLDGWAVEARLYAEDPARGFLPSTGRLVRYAEPRGEGIRIDSGVDEGSEISVFYDPMIAKLVAHGGDRQRAMGLISKALDETVIRGPTTNVSFLAAVLGHESFRNGEISTHFIEQHFGDRTDFVTPDRAVLDKLAALAVAMHLKLARRAARISGQIQGWQYTPDRHWCVLLNDTSIEVESLADDQYRTNSHEVSVTLDWLPGDHLVRAFVDREPLTLQADPIAEGYVLRHKGAVLTTIVRTKLAADFVARMPAKPKPDMTKLLTSPMPGQIVSVAVKPGQAIDAGEELCVLEAMKMENVLRATAAGTIDQVKVQAGDTVHLDDVLLTFA